MVTVREIAFVDETITDLEEFLEGVRPEVERVVLSRSEDALVKIAETLESYSGLSAVHIVTHGSPGVVEFGSGALSLDNVTKRASELAAIEIGRASCRERV